MNYIEEAERYLQAVENEVIIYVAGRYTGDTQKHIKHAENVSLKLIQKGWTVFTPHKNFANYEILEDFISNLNYENIMKMCALFLKKCGVIILLNGWENSKGACIEYAIAKILGIKIYFEENGIPEY